MTVKNRKPEIGSIKYSEYFKENIVLTRFINNDWWYFTRESNPHQEYKSPHKWSDLKSKPNKTHVI